MKAFTFKPKLFSTLKTYNKKTFTADLMAGIIVGIVALPLAIAFAIASGVPPEKGIITAIIAGFIISAFGGSRVQIGGPTGAFIIIVYDIVQNYGMQGLVIATLLAGIFMILLGVLKLGTIIKYIPYPIIVGFTSGIAVTIFSTQIKDLLGMTMDANPSDFIEKWIAYGRNIGNIDWWSACGHAQHRRYRTDSKDQQEDPRLACRNHLDDHYHPAAQAVCRHNINRDHRRQI